MTPCVIRYPSTPSWRWFLAHYVMITDFPNTKKVLAGIEQSGWNLQEPHKWSYYFYDENRQALNRLFEELSDDKFQLESLTQSDDEEWILHVSKIEVLTAEKLHRRNMAFNELAETCNVQLYDGWDIEKVKAE